MKMVKLAFAVGLGLMAIAAPAKAAVLVAITQSDAGVMAIANGSIDLTDLTFVGRAVPNYDWGHVISPYGGSFVIGGGFMADVYAHIDGPSSFGGLPGAIAESNGGELLAIGSGHLGVPWGYVSGAPISGIGSYYSNETLSSLGLTLGNTYRYTWGTGAHADSLTIRIGDGLATPEPATWMLLLLGFAGLGYAGYRRSKKDRLAALA
jgi:PEP-CTERM motif